MEHTVKLSALPADLRFPPDLTGKIRYDEATRRLVFQGQMWKAQYDRLVALHDDVEYLRALEQLFRVSTEAAEPVRRPLRVVVAMLLGAAVLVLGLWWYFGYGRS